MYVIQGQAERDTGTEVWAVGIVEDYGLAVEIQSTLENSNDRVQEALNGADFDAYEEVAEAILEDAKYRDEYGEDWIKAHSPVEYTICSAPLMARG